MALCPMRNEDIIALSWFIENIVWLAIEIYIILLDCKSLWLESGQYGDYMGIYDRDIKYYICMYSKHGLVSLMGHITHMGSGSKQSGIKYWNGPVLKCLGQTNNCHCISCIYHTVHTDVLLYLQWMTVPLWYPYAQNHGRYRADILVTSDTASI